MKRTQLLAGTSLILLTSMAHADGLAQANAQSVETPTYAAMPAFDGAYAGFSFGQFGGSGTENIPSVAMGDLPLEDRGIGQVFAGYNHQMGNFVIGAELGVTTAALPVDGFNLTLSGINDIAARAGYVFGNVMLYGSAGWSWANLVTITSGNVASNLSGMNYGGGVEYNVSEGVFLGLDYRSRDLDGTQANILYDFNVETYSVRAGFRF